MLSGGEEAIMITHTQFQCKQERLNLLTAIVEYTQSSHLQLLLLGSEPSPGSSFYLICSHSYQEVLSGVNGCIQNLSLCLTNFIMGLYLKTDSFYNNQG